MIRNAWIDPQGLVIEVYQGHDRYASELLKSEMGIIKMLEMLDDVNLHPYEVLHSRGWVRVRPGWDGSIEILGNCIDLTKPARNTIDPPMNSKQLRSAKRICADSGTLFHNAINDKRFW